MNMTPAAWIMAPLIALLGACASNPNQTSMNTGAALSELTDASHFISASQRPVSFSKAGSPVTLDASSRFVQRGKASFYGRKFHGRKTSSGDVFDMNKMTAAHKTLPMDSYVQVINLDNGKAVVVKVNDRGPFIKGRIIDLSYAAASQLGFVRQGVAKVEIRTIAAEQLPDYVQRASQQSADASPPPDQRKRLLE